MTHLPKRTFYTEPAFLLTLLFVAIAYFARLGTLNLRGEEPRRAEVAFEMQYFHDYLAPREQGALFLSRPPLQNWLIAASTTLAGSRTPFVIRVHSVLAVLLTCALLYGYSRRFLPPSAAAITALIFATMGEMFQTGKMAESDALFACLLAGALILWHWGFMDGWKPIATWSAAYIALALALLCKGGLQPPVYFYGPIALLLLTTKRVRYFFSLAHLLAALLCLVIIASWLIPYFLHYGPAATHRTWFGDTTDRFAGWALAEFLHHLAQFPLEFLGGMLPWSILLAVYLIPSTARWMRARYPAALFSTIILAIAFPTCWIPPGGNTRYLAPLYPFVAILVGIVIHAAADPQSPLALRRFWQRFTATFAILIALAAIAFPAASLFLRHTTLNAWSESPLRAILYTIAFAILALIAWRTRKSSDSPAVTTAALVICVAVTILSVGLFTDVRLARSNDTPAQVQQLISQLPPHQKLVSIGRIEPAFTYLYGQYIPALPSQPSEISPAPGEYFCFTTTSNVRPEFTFLYQQIAVIHVDRNRKSPIQTLVIVARRLPPPQRQPTRNHPSQPFQFHPNSAIMPDSLAPAQGPSKSKPRVGRW